MSRPSTGTRSASSSSSASTTSPSHSTISRSVRLRCACVRRTTSRRRWASSNTTRSAPRPVAARRTAGGPGRPAHEAQLRSRRRSEGGRLRRHARGVDAVHHVARVDQHGAGHRSLRAGRLQGRHAPMDWQTVVTRRTKKTRRQGRLERLPHLRHRRRHPEPDLGQLMVADPRRRGSAGPNDPEMEKPRDLRPGDRSGQVQGAGCGGAEPCLDQAQYGWLGMVVRVTRHAPTSSVG